MAILKHPHDILRIRCSEVEEIDDSVKEDAKKIVEAFKTIDFPFAITCGLAANQIGLSRRMILLKSLGKRYIMINPEITKSYITVPSFEMCASIPGKIRLKKRKLITKVRYLGLDSKSYHKTFFDISSFTLQQEIDHLDGKLIID